MTKLIRSLSIVAVAGAFALQSAFAGECCDATTAKVKAGQACEKCADHRCCKDAARAVSKEIAKEGGKAAECATCAAKAKDKAAKS